MLADIRLVTLSGDRAAGASDVTSMLGALDQSTRSQVSAITSTGTQVNFTLRGGADCQVGNQRRCAPKGSGSRHFARECEGDDLRRIGAQSSCDQLGLIHCPRVGLKDRARTPNFFPTRSTLNINLQLKVEGLMQGRHPWRHRKTTWQ